MRFKNSQRSGVQVALKEKPGGNGNFRGPQKMDGRIERRRHRETVEEVFSGEDASAKRAQ